MSLFNHSERDRLERLEAYFDREQSEKVMQDIRNGRGLQPIENGENSGIFRGQKSPIKQGNSITTKSEFYCHSQNQQVVLSDDQFKAIMKELKAIRKALKKRSI